MIAAAATHLTPFLKLWPLLLLVAAVGAVKLALWWREEQRIARSGIAEVDAMDGITFERFLATLFSKLGYRVERTQARGDFGADLVVERDGERMVVQAKRWSKKVGVKAVQEAHAAPAMYACSRALVVTNNRFTEPAKELARANRVELWDRDVLIDRMLV
jgi:restriction system protein